MSEEIQKPESESKSLWKSKTFWVNLIAFCAFLIQSKTGFLIDENLQAQALMIVNIVLRTITKEPIAWKKGKDDGNSEETP